MSKENMYIDKLHIIDQDFPNEKEAREYFLSKEFINSMILKFAHQLPILHLIKVKGEKCLVFIRPEKLGVEMDWKFYSKQVPITHADILAEKNIEKRRILMLEFGIHNFFEDYIVNQEDSYGKLSSAKVKENLEVNTHNFIEVINGTQEIEHEYITKLREAKVLAKDNKKIYHVPTSKNMKTAKEAVAFSFGVPKGWLPLSGFDVES